MSDIMQQLARIKDRGEITEIAYQFCEFLKRIEKDGSNALLIAGCLVAQRKEEGDVCIDLNEESGRTIFSGDAKAGIETPELQEWIRELKASTCVGTPGESCPLILDEANRLYLQKYWKYEISLANQLLKKAETKDDEAAKVPVREELDDFFETSGEVNWQKVAAWTALRKKLTVISGGPGTGKTTTVVKILLLMARLDLLGHVALAAPTGKAASRLIESVNGALKRFQPDEQILEKLPEQAVTIHKLLGARRYGSGFRYDRDNPLPYDVVIIDEASMIDLALMIKLVDALPDHAKLILLGDKDQLASVEAGAVLGSICADTENKFSDSFIEDARATGMVIPDSCRNSNPRPLTDHIVLLEKSYRFGEESGIGQLATSILKGEAGAVMDILHSEDYPDVIIRDFKNSTGFTEILDHIVSSNFERLVRESEIEKALAHLSRMGILCVHRRGPLGAEQVNRIVEQLLRREHLIPAASNWYAGKPVMVTQNDYLLGLRNGEMGITLEEETGDLKVFFPESEGGYRSFYPSRLSHVETAFAITVHKSQGSEFDDIAVIMPQRVSPICSRELFYTAVTRARSSCTIVGQQKVVEETVSRKINRSSGLQDRLWDHYDE